MKKIHFMLTAFRDGFQSVFGARVFAKDYLAVVETAARSGITHFEAGGGAMFQSAYFYANEDAFSVMDAFRQATGAEAELQTLARGINVVALDSQPRDIIKLHAELFKKHGMTTIRNFDALNDVNNLIYSAKCIKDAGLKHEVAVTMMELPPGCAGAHDAEFYIGTLRKILDSGIPYDSICFKDASGTATPRKVNETISLARKLVGDNVKIVFHSHETAGACVNAYMAAVEAGADQIDLSIAPLSGGACQPDVLTMWHAMRGTDYTLDIDINQIIKLEDTLKNALKDYFLPPEATKVEPLIPFFPMPGGALTANTQMLRDNGLMDKYPQVIAAMGEVVRKGGFGASVTPVSQFYFQQAFNNVMFGPWKKIADGYGKMALGYFGKTPVSPDAEVINIAREQLKLEPTTENPLDINDRNPKKGAAAARRMLEENKLAVTDENIFIVSSCQDKGIAFLKGEGVIGVRKHQPAGGAQNAPAPARTNTYNVMVNGKTYTVRLDGNTAEVDGLPYNISVECGVAAPGAAAARPSSEAIEELVSPLPGLILKVLRKPGNRVSAGETILIMESMKMETPINSPISGVISALPAKQGEQVQAGKILVAIRK